MRKILCRSLVCGALMILSLRFVHAQPRYIVTDLGTLGGTASVALCINDSSVIGGWSYGSAGAHPFMYRNGQMIDLGLLPNARPGADHDSKKFVSDAFRADLNSYSLLSLPNAIVNPRIREPLGTRGSSANGINNHGVLVGNAIAQGSGKVHAFLHENGTMTDILTLGGHESVATDINEAGDAVGYSIVIDSINNFHAFRYHNGNLSQLENSEIQSFAKGINDSGDIVGLMIRTDGSFRGFRFHNASLAAINGFPGDTYTDANAINKAGHIVGYSGTTTNSGSAIMYVNGSLKNLGALGFGATGLGINDSDQVVGRTYVAPSNVVHAFLWQSDTLSDLNSLISPGSGWTLLNATAINNRGEIVGYGTHNGQTRAFLLTPGLVVTRPQAGERWIAGAQDTIRWTGGTAGRFVNIGFSADSGMTDSVVAIAIPSDSGYCVWNVPDTLTTLAKLRFVDSATNDTVAVSDTFRVKGYVLTRMTPDGHYEAFKPNVHGWNYLNGTLWPRSWWSQFNYLTALDPNTNSAYPAFFQSVPDSTFIDWPLWVDLFSADTSYWSTFFGIYRERSELKWRSNGSPHNGSCFGFAASSFLAFNYKDQFLAQNQGVPLFSVLYATGLTAGIQKTINRYFAYQFGIQSLNNDVTGQPKDPRTTLAEIMKMFIGDSTNIRTITIYNNGGGGGGAHTMAPIAIRKDNSGPSRYRLYLYDSNNPGLTNPYILVDSLNNTWTDATGLGPTWTGTNHFYLEIPVSNYLNRPVMGKQPRSSGDIKGGKDAVNTSGSSNIEIYNTSKANVMYTASDGKRIGLMGGAVTDEIDAGIAIFDKNGHVSDPIGYYIPDDSYAIRLSDITDTAGKAVLTVIKNDVMYHYERGGVTPTQVDRFVLNEGFSVASSDPEEKLADLEVAVNLAGSDRIFRVRNIPLRQDDSLNLAETEQEKLVLKNYGSGKSYDLEINERSAGGQGFFQHFSVSIESNSSHFIAPRWDSLGQIPVDIWVDLDNNGTIDDTLSILDQTTGVKTRGDAATPLEFELHQNYPNPFNPTTEIGYTIPKAGRVSITVSDVLGRVVATLVDDFKSPGEYTVTWNAGNFSSGMYFYRMASGEYVSVKKLILLK